MISKKEMARRICELEIQLDVYEDIIDDVLKRIKKLEKGKKGSK